MRILYYFCSVFVTTDYNYLMAFTNNVMIVRHKLLAMMVHKWKEDRLCAEIDRLPIELSPRRSEVLGRCCVHKERAVWK